MTHSRRGLSACAAAGPVCVCGGGGGGRVRAVRSYVLEVVLGQLNHHAILGWVGAVAQAQDNVAVTDRRHQRHFLIAGDHELFDRDPHAVPFAAVARRQPSPTAARTADSKRAVSVGVGGLGSGAQSLPPPPPPPPPPLPRRASRAYLYTTPNAPRPIGSRNSRSSYSMTRLCAGAAIPVSRRVGRGRLLGPGVRRGAAERWGWCCTGSGSGGSAAASARSWFRRATRSSTRIWASIWTGGAISAHGRLGQRKVSAGGGQRQGRRVGVTLTLVMPIPASCSGVSR